MLSYFPLWKDLPLDILIDRILFEYCDGKTLSQLALTILIFGGIDNNVNEDEDNRSITFESLCNDDDDNNNNNNNNNQQQDNNDDDIIQRTILLQQFTESNRTTTEQQQQQQQQQQRKRNKSWNTRMVFKVIPEIGILRIRNIVNRLEKETKLYNIDAIEWIRSLPQLFFGNDTTNDDDDDDVDNDIKNQNTNATTTTTTTIETISLSSLSLCKRSSSIPKTLRDMTDFLLLVDYIENSIRRYNKVCAGCYEWPIWCGTIIVDTVEETIRVRRSARVVITIPIAEKLHPISTVAPSGGGCSVLLYNTNPTQLMKCEPYHTIPVPPWGKLYGLTEQDEHILQNQIGSYLVTTNQIAIPAFTNYSSTYDVLNIRIMTQQQAYYRRQTGNSTGNRTTVNNATNANNTNNNNNTTTTIRHRQWKPPTVPTEWIVTNNNTNNNDDETSSMDSTKLICTWEVEDSSTITDSMFANERDSISYLLQLQQIQNDLLNK